MQTAPRHSAWASRACPPPACAHPALLIALLTRTRPDMLAGVDADDEVAKASIASCWNGLYAVGSTLAPLASSYIYSFVGFARTCSVFAGFGMLVVVAMTLSATGGCRSSPHVGLKGARGSHGHLAEPLLTTPLHEGAHDGRRGGTRSAAV